MFVTATGSTDYSDDHVDPDCTVDENRGCEEVGEKRQDRGGSDVEGWVVLRWLDSAATSPCWLVGQA